jgi:hypothetical protein
MRIVGKIQDPANGKRQAKVSFFEKKHPYPILSSRSAITVEKRLAWEWGRGTSLPARDKVTKDLSHRCHACKHPSAMGWSHLGAVKRSEEDVPDSRLVNKLGC